MGARKIEIYDALNVKWQARFASAHLPLLTLNVHLLLMTIKEISDLKGPRQVISKCQVLTH